MIPSFFLVYFANYEFMGPLNISFNQIQIEVL